MTTSKEILARIKQRDAELKEQGGAAFARPAFDSDTQGNDSQRGMSLRDYFAAKAMQALLGKEDTTILRGYGRPDEEKLADIAMYSYAIADAMLDKKRSKYES